MLDFDEIAALVAGRLQLRLLGIDGLPAAGKSTLARRLVAASGGASVELDEVRQAGGRVAPVRPGHLSIRLHPYEAFRAAVRGLSVEGWCRYRPRAWERMFLPSVELYLRTLPVARADVFIAGRAARVEDS